MKKCAVFDLDGALCDSEHRRPLMDGPVKNFTEFTKLAAYDDVNQNAADLWQAQELLNCEIVVMTGRPEWNRKITTDWLERHGFTTARLYMRPNNDKSPDENLKRRYLETLRKDGYQVMLAVDSRKRAVAMWMSEGVPTRVLFDIDY